MVAIILAAGYGTRLYPLTKDKPKALLPVREKPILEHLMEKLVAPGVGVDRAVLVSNHKFAPVFQKWVERATPTVPCEVLDDGTTSDENRLGSVGDLAFVIRSKGLEKEDLLVMGSDNLFRDPLLDFMAFARGKRSITLGVYELPDRTLASRYGVLTVGPDARVSAFTEKPKEPLSALISTAVYFFPRAEVPLVLEYVSSRETADTLGSFIAWLIRRRPVYASRLEGPWFDIGDIASYALAQKAF